MAFRPNGVTAVAIIYIILAALGVVGAIVIEEVIIPYYQTLNIIDLLLIPLAYYFTAGLPQELALFIMSGVVLFVMSPSSGMNVVGYIPNIHVGVLIGLIIVPLLIISAIGLFGMKQWGRYLGIIVGIFIIGGIVTGIIVFEISGLRSVLLAFFSCESVFWEGVVVFYLYKVAKKDFETR